MLQPQSHFRGFSLFLGYNIELYLPIIALPPGIFTSLKPFRAATGKLYASLTNILLKWLCCLMHKTLMFTYRMMTEQGDLAAVCEYKSGNGEEFDLWHSPTNVAAFILWLIVKCSFPKDSQLLFSFELTLKYEHVFSTLRNTNGSCCKHR